MAEGEKADVLHTGGQRRGWTGIPAALPVTAALTRTAGSARPGRATTPRSRAPR
ncbi:hypothetical protein [Ornithinimicrobium kibberense]|uniref:hypothetical protein n=1 Tax=Ornithinimicrobium kibberense TaxID=282060 RepID=UPI003610FF52